MASGVQWRKPPTNSVLILLIIDQSLLLQFYIQITFSSEKYCSGCIIIAKTFLDIDEFFMPLSFFRMLLLIVLAPKQAQLPLK